MTEVEKEGYVSEFGSVGYSILADHVMEKYNMRPSLAKNLMAQVYFFIEQKAPILLAKEAAHGKNGLFIRDIRMPTSCSECQFISEGAGYMSTYCTITEESLGAGIDNEPRRDFAYAWERSPRCPLIDINPD